VGDAGRELSPEEQVELQRYLALNVWVSRETEALLQRTNVQGTARTERIGMSN
jgi:hypothetical protein